MTNSLLWFRQDLRLRDNPALTAAVNTGLPIVAVYILDDETPGAWRMGAASRWWLHHSLTALDEALRKTGITLTLRKGNAEAVLPKLAKETNAASIFWNRCYEPRRLEQDAALEKTLRANGFHVESFNGSLLNEPWTIQTKGKTPFQVFTPYWRAAQTIITSDKPLAAPKTIKAPAKIPKSDRLKDWNLLPTKPDWAKGLRAAWQPGSLHAEAKLRDFMENAATNYARDHNDPAKEATSWLSPYLHWGEISPRQIWYFVQSESTGHPDAGAAAFLRQLGWRDFCYNLLYHFPDFPEKPFNKRFTAFRWKTDKAILRKWQQGKTGYPLVDAGMRQLWQTGWMHNRVRLVVASFLVKHLLINWTVGEAWFWDTLVDANLANNSANWQWVAGSGADAAPYFRIFNPILQSRKFDPDGAYIRRFVPELAALPAKHIHEPWKAPAPILKAAGITLGKTYPLPIIDHETGRARALKAYKDL